MPFIIDARNMGGGSIGSAAGGDTSTGTRNNVTLAAPWNESKEYLKGDLATNNGDLYQAQKSVPAGVQISDEDYWALVVAGDKSKETEQLRKDIGSLGDLETESKDNLVNAINEVNSIQPDWNQNDETKKDYIKNRPFWYFTTETHAVNKEEITSTNGTCVNGFRIERDKVYHVTYENQVYKLTSRVFYFSYASMNVYVIGRTPSGMSDFDSDPDDVPFSLFYMDKTNYSAFELVAPPAIDLNIYVEEFNGTVEHIKKIPEQCIPYIQPDCNETDTNSPAFIKNFPEIHGCFLGVVEGSTTTGNRFPINSKARRIQVYGIDTTGTTTSWHLVGNMSSLSLCSYSPQRGIEINVFEIFYSEADEYWYAKNLTKPGKVEKHHKGRLDSLLFRPDARDATLRYQLAQWS